MIGAAFGWAPVKTIFPTEDLIASDKDLIGILGFH